MADDVENNEPENQEVVQITEGENEASEVVDNEAVTNESNDNEELEEEVIVSIGEEAPPQEEREPAPAWVKELRKQNREQAKRIRELEGEVKVEHNPTLPPEPTLEECDFDPETYKQKLAEWFERKRQVEALENEAKARQEAEAKAWAETLESYEKKKASLGVKDYEDAEAFVLETFSDFQKGIAIQGSENPALLVYALGKNPEKARELAAITDLTKFTFALAKLEMQLKVTKRKSTPAPEKQLSSSGSISGAVDSTLERLRAEAEKTGDYTKVSRYKAQKRAA